MQELELSSYGRKASQPSPVSKLMTAFADSFRSGVDVNLGVGYVNEATIPHERIVEALQTVATRPDSYPNLFNYGGPKGAQFLIDAIKRQLHANPDNGLGKKLLTTMDIVIGTGGATSLLQGIAQVVKPGIVITSDPVYYIYTHTLERFGFKVIAVAEDEHGINPEHLEAKLAQLGSAVAEISFFYFVTVNNPSGTILTNQRCQQLVTIAQRLSVARGQEVPIFFDNAYTQLLHDPTVEPIKSVLPYDNTGIVFEIETVSKILAPSLRVGYIIGKPGALLQALTEYNSDSALSAPMMTQAITSLLLDTNINEQRTQVNNKYREKATLIKAMMAKYFANTGYNFTGGQAGFYFYITFDDIETHEDSPFFKYCNRITNDPKVDIDNGEFLPRVAYIPGVLCVHKEGSMREISKRQMRLSYGFEEVEHIERGFAVMRSAIAFAYKQMELA